LAAVFHTTVARDKESIGKVMLVMQPEWSNSVALPSPTINSPKRSSSKKWCYGEHRAVIEGLMAHTAQNKQNTLQQCNWHKIAEKVGRPVNQVRSYYYRQMSRIAHLLNLIDFTWDIKVPIAAINALICYGEMRYNQNLDERGAACTEFARTLRERILSHRKELDMLKNQRFPTPNKITIHLLPMTDDVGTMLSSAGWNPRLQMSIKPNKTIAKLAFHLHKKWPILGAKGQKIRIYPWKPTDHHGWTVDDNNTTMLQVYHQLGYPPICKLFYDNVARDAIRKDSEFLMGDVSLPLPLPEISQDAHCALPLDSYEPVQVSPKEKRQSPLPKPDANEIIKSDASTAAELPILGEMSFSALLGVPPSGNSWLLSPTKDSLFSPLKRSDSLSFLSPRKDLSRGWELSNDAKIFQDMLGSGHDNIFTSPLKQGVKRSLQGSSSDNNFLSDQLDQKDISGFVRSASFVPFSGYSENNGRPSKRPRTRV